jgi:uncharacterized OB-fold protein
MAQPNMRRPDPTPNTTSAKFWNSAAHGVLQLQYCRACDRSIFYPRERCPYCWSAALVWREATGRGVVASYTIAHRPGHPAFAGDAPFVIALIDLEEGPRMLSNVVGCDCDTVRIGLPVTVHWTERGEFTLPQFAPSEGSYEEGQS